MDALLVAKIISMICLGLLTWLVSGWYTLHTSYFAPQVGLLPLVGVRLGWMKAAETEQSQVFRNP